MAKRKVKNEIQAIYGDEPSFPKFIIDDYQAQVIKQLNWYNYAMKNSDLRDSLVQFGTQEFDLDAESIKSIPDDRIGTIGAVARLHLRGFPLKLDDLQAAEVKLNKLCQQFQPTVTKPVDTKELRIKEKIKEWELSKKIGSAMEPFDNALDQVLLKGEKNVKLPDIAVELSGVQTKEVIGYFNSIKNELELAIAGDMDFKEAYPQSRYVLKRAIQFIVDIVNAFELKLNQVKASKPVRPRKRRMVPASKKVAKLNYMTAHPELGLKSVNPEKVVGCQKLLVFNTKKRQLQLYVASDVTLGIQVKGSTLNNFTEESSGKTVRKPEELLPEVLKATKARVSKLYEDIRSVAKPLTGRINKDCILLKVW